MAGHFVYNSRSLWLRLDSHLGLRFRNLCYAATSLLCITAISSPPTKQTDLHTTDMWPCP